VLWRSGLRISEALALELRDIDLDVGTLRVRHGKGDKSRTVGVDEQTAALLARWLERRKKIGAGARAPVFCTLDGSRIDTSYVRHLLPRLAAKAGVERRVHAHGLRHTYAAELARGGTAINVIRDESQPEVALELQAGAHPGIAELGERVAELACLGAVADVASAGEAEGVRWSAG